MGVGVGLHLDALVGSHTVTGPGSGRCSSAEAVVGEKLRPIGAGVCQMALARIIEPSLSSWWSNMALKKKVKDRLVLETQNAISRANVLYDRIALNGAVRNGANYSPLMNPDRRDIATFIFFEVAARYEAFCCDAFRIEVRRKFSVEPGRADNLMGSADRGLAGVMGWAAPHVVQARAQNLIGKRGFFGRFATIVAQPTYDVLTHAHKVRNRVAHSGSKAVSEYNRILGQLGVPAASRKGLSVGRLLMDYPLGSAVGDRWFNRFVAAYERVVDEFNARVVI